MHFLVFFLIGKISALLFGAYYFRYLPRAYKLIFYLIVIATICESYGYFIVHYLHRPNIWLFNLYMPTEVWMLGLSAIYLTINSKVKNIFFLLLIINTVVWLITVLNNPISSFANFSMVCGCILLTTMYLYISLTNVLFKKINTLKQPIFWLCLSSILYFGCDIPYMALHDDLAKYSPSLGLRFDYINVTLDIIRYPLIAISFLLLGRQRQSEVNTA